MKRWLNPGLVILITLIALFAMAEVRSAGISNSYGTTALANANAANEAGVVADVNAETSQAAIEMDSMDDSIGVRQGGQADEQVNQQTNPQEEELYGKFLFDDN